MFKRDILKELNIRLQEKRKFIQVLTGPRQTGKTTIAQQLMETVDIPCYYVSADEPTLKDNSWIEQHWEIGRIKAGATGKIILLFDELQKIYNWSETVKRLWDEDSLKKRNVYVVILGSSQLLLHKGLSESLAGRFEVIPVSHWSFPEMRTAFNWNMDQYIFYGGYPGSANLINDQTRWLNYILDSLIEPTIAKDILMMTRVDKPILLRRLFELGCYYSGQILSYQKMLGQLHDAGNTTTLAHYLDLLSTAGLLTGITKYAGQKVRQRSSSPKLQVLNTGLMSAFSRWKFTDVKTDPEWWGRLVESAIGADLINRTRGTDIELFYWSGYNREVDFILTRGKSIIALEVKSTRKKINLPGIELFNHYFPGTKKVLVGGQGLTIEDFLTRPPEDLFN